MKVSGLQAPDDLPLSLPREEAPVPIGEKCMWAPKDVAAKKKKITCPCRESNPCRLERRLSLYWLKILVSFSYFSHLSLFYKEMQVRVLSYTQYTCTYLYPSIITEPTDGVISVVLPVSDLLQGFMCVCSQVSCSVVSNWPLCEFMDACTVIFGIYY